VYRVFKGFKVSRDHKELLELPAFKVCRVSKDHRGL
jgi:hypothetical protein